MENNKQLPHTAADSDVTPVQYWGALAFSILGMLVTVLLLRNAFQLPRVGVAYVAMAVYAFAFSTAIPVILLVMRGRQRLGVQIGFFMVILVFGTTPFIYTGRAITASFSLVAIAAIFISQLLPRELRRRYIVITAAVLATVWITEWINPAWRLTVEVNRYGPTTAILFGVILGAILIRQAWSRNNIRSRFLVLSLGMTLIATLAVAATSVVSFFSAGQQGQEIASDILRNQIQGSLNHQTLEAVQTNDLILQSIRDDAEAVAHQATFIFENRGAFTSQSYWKADDHMFVGPEGQYMNGTSDVSTVFVPNTVQVDDNLKQQLERLAYLDMAFVPVLKDNPNVVAIYFVGTNEISWFYPNINLGSFIPADYLPTQDIFYTAGTPENDPDRQVVWTPVYDDPAGQGVLVSAIAPVYVRNRFLGIIGVDVSLAGLTKTIEEEDFGQGKGAYAFLIDDQGKTLALPEQGYRDLLGREPAAGEFGVDLVASARPEFASLFDSMRSGETGSQSVFVADQEFLVAYAPLSSTKWYIASVANTEQVLAPASTLRTTLQQLTNSLVYQRIIPLGIALMVLVLLAGAFFTNRLVQPIEQLTTSASKIGRGEWDTSLPQSELVEIDGLSSTLGNMARELRTTLESLEQRVAARTKDLATVAELSTTTATIHETKKLLQAIVALSKERFELYHAHIYLLDEDGKNLVLAAGAGEPGRVMVAEGHSIPLDRERSLVARAARERKGVTVNDVTQASDFLPNPLLPDTRSELAVPMIVGGSVIGVFDIQSEQVGRFTDSDINIQTTLAAQLATSIQNVRSFEKSKKQADFESLVNTIGQRIQRTTSIEETLQTAIREIGTALSAQRVRANLVVDRQAGETPSSQN